MRLKSLEIKGFKSFANETVLHFEEDVIGVVGPNGSGKSNIVDAIRWVLGEQKGKELRLESMGDVIFNGTKKRKPSAVALVTLTFDNTKHLLPSEYQTVSISRVLYRSGESEYKLNGVVCRLKDITALLMDTGIGSNSYAIIALGMVDDILSDKENARRRMFEQAAGVAKYKKRKHETMLKLKNTSADLARIEDLLFEIQNNLKALEKQARRTQRFVNLKAKYKDRSIHLAVKKVGHIKEDYANLEKQIETEKNVYRQLEADLIKKEKQLETLKKENLDDEKSVGGFQRELNMLIGTIRSMENEKNLLQQKVIFIDQTKKRLESQITTNLQKIDLLSEEMLRLQSKIDISEKTFQDITIELEKATEQKSVVQEAYQKAKSEKDHLTEAQQSLEKEIHMLETEIAIQQANLQNISHGSDVSVEELDAIKGNIEQHSNILKGIDEEQESVHKKLSSVEEKELKRLGRIQQTEKEISDTREALIKTHRALDAKKHEHNLLKDMVARLEGFPESIKFLSKSKSWDVEAPLLSDIIYCDPQYRTIVEHLLEPYLNHFVVRNVEEAANAIRLLHSSQKGKANFFILDRFDPATSVGQSQSPAGVTPLMKFIETDSQYAMLIMHLLGNVYLTEQTPIDHSYDDDVYREMTLMDQTGMFIRKSFSLSGGSIGLFEGKKLGRKKNLEHLAKEIKALEKQQAKAETKLEEQRGKLETLKNAHQETLLQSLRAELASIHQKQIEKRSFLGHQQKRYEEIQQKIFENAEKRSSIEADLKAKMAFYEEKTKVVEDSSSILDEADDAFNLKVENLAKANQAFNEVQLKFIQQQNLLETIKREFAYKEKQKNEIIELDEQYAVQLDNDMVELGKIEQALQNLEQELHEHYATKGVKESELTTIEQQFYQVRNHINELEEKTKKITKEQQNSQFLVNQLKEEYSNLKFTITSVSERLHIEFAVRLEDVLETVEIDETPVDELQHAVDKMKYRLENFGEINPMAIEAYEEMQTRHDSINDQREDILEAKESLLKTIEEIETTATEKFTTAFDQVRENFIMVFRSLFTEDDNCDLILEDPSQPLESKIRIIAKPKGKRPKSLSQLSGGEKTLTATALLFALYLLKPAPFCIFDEVDAPLDDANILKFNKIVKKFSQESQFIIVTHNKSTMAAVDVIYGVYMEEMGVSSLSPVDFRSFQHQEFLETLN